MMLWDVLHKGPIVLLTSANLGHWVVKPRFLNSQLMVNVLVESCFESPCYAVYILKSIPLVCVFDIYKFWSFIFIYPLPPPPPRPKVTGNIASKYRGLKD